ncbi:MAG: 2-hydroxyacyl-CoA dehydratase [bacterium]|nr:2-hydroxyacyl-CoA dehydratase [bacterium]
MNKKIISFPHLGNYYVPISFLLKKVTSFEVKPSPPITKKTVELGSKHSPDFVCIPFKYNLGNFIETLENGANILIQAGGGCRYGYYSEVQEKILRDLGYEFEFINLIDGDHFTVKELFQTFKKLNPKLSFIKFAYYTLLTLLMIRYMDEIDQYIRNNIGFEEVENSFSELQKQMLDDFSKTRSYFGLTHKFLSYRKKFRKLKINKPKDCLKVGIIGELYTSMEPFSSFFLEKELAKMKIQVRRFTNVSYLLYQKKLHRKKMLKYIPEYCKYTIGADGMDNVYRSKYLAMEGYDGIIHIKPFGCTPEIGAIPIIRKVCEDYHMPVIFFSFDSATSDTGIKTRLEAFYDMLKERKDRL